MAEAEGAAAAAVGTMGNTPVEEMVVVAVVDTKAQEEAAGSSLPALQEVHPVEEEEQITLVAV